MVVRIKTEDQLENNINRNISHQSPRTTSNGGLRKSRPLTFQKNKNENKWSKFPMQKSRKGQNKTKETRKKEEIMKEFLRNY